MSHLQDVAIQAAETLQTAHIIGKPSLEHDRAPSTAADAKKPVRLDHSPDADNVSAVDEDEIPVSIVKPEPRRPQMPPLPDLRFEQSYLASIKDAPSWHAIAYITVRDQVRNASPSATTLHPLTTCSAPGPNATSTRRSMDAHRRRVAPLERWSQVQRPQCRFKDQTMVVGRQ